MADMVTMDLVSPEKLLLSDEFEMVVLPGAEGDFGVLAGHLPITSTLRPGVISIYEGDKEKERIFVNGGFAEVSNDKITVLAEEAIFVADLNRADLEQRIQDAREDEEDAKDDETRRRAAENQDHLKQLLEAMA
ncbi:MAG: F0F1 ATP synthase subunit epsilon [Sneathiella sp.]|jgi:F-type H+-transporting ATPase subunit epsilon|uniref:F0F1 ATP synthase subunit epsilon n=1 Tax=Sneathiella sp. TaxID=1964365 RepID=UPI000C60DE1A|nr:F0F1 ATP synthase subunit epsilon [Sneathiella sp.]MAL78940.1 F0F1 ATP synthase subunit epsilon [Sneathiella sp.]